LRRVDGAFRDAAIYRDYGLFVSEEIRTCIASGYCTGICSNHGRATVSGEKAAELYVDIYEIEDLRDLSWPGN